MLRSMARETSTRDGATRTRARGARSRRVALARCVPRPEWAPPPRATSARTSWFREAGAREGPRRAPLDGRHLRNRRWSTSPVRCFRTTTPTERASAFCLHMDVLQFCKPYRRAHAQTCARGRAACGACALGPASAASAAPERRQSGIGAASAAPKAASASAASSASAAAAASASIKVAVRFG